MPAGVIPGLNFACHAAPKSEGGTNTNDLRTALQVRFLSETAIT
jgi:hypothetical protein